MTTLRRNLKNTVNNYTDIQCKVREATCNEPWGPATSVMTEIADATYSVVEFAEIMTILWKRLNDSGKNWRHVYKANKMYIRKSGYRHTYKALLVLDYIIKRGSERVAQQCKEQIYSFLTLQEFRFVDKDGKDQGASVREKARQLVSLLKDEDRLKSERKKALQAKERFAQNSTGIGSHNSKIPKSSGTLGGLMGRSGESSRSAELARHGQAVSVTDGKLSTAMEQARPSDRDEEDLQLELALAISKEEADKNREEDEVLRATLERSKTETLIVAPPTLLSLSRQPPPRPATSPLDPWGMPLQPGAGPQPPPPADDPWAPSTTYSAPIKTQSLLDTSLDTEFYQPSVSTTAATTNFGLTQPSNYAVINTSATPLSTVAPQPAPDLLDPWSAPQQTFVPSVAPTSSGSGNLLDTNNLLDSFDPFGSSISPTATNNQPVVMGSSLATSLSPTSSSATSLPPTSKMGTILDNRTKHLVNIDNLISTQTPNSGSTNPFGTPGPAPGSVFSGESSNPFLSYTSQQPALSLNELRGPTGSTTTTNDNNSTNPFC